jgi:hypothetical protein
VTPTSTERPDTRRFTRGIVAIVVVLAVLCAGFLVLDYLHGPKLSSATVDTRQVVSQANQQLRMFADQNLAAVRRSQVTITPAASFTVRSSGQQIAVQFTERLEYSQRYTVTVKRATSIYQDQPATLSYAFTTDAGRLYYLHRADPAAASGDLDTISSTGLRGSAERVVYTGKRIQAFVAFPAVLAVVSIQDDGTDALSLVSLDDPSKIEQLVLPGPGTITKLQASPDAGVLGFVFTSAGSSADPAYSSDLMTVDLTAQHTVTPVLGLDGLPLSVLDWAYLSGGTSIVAQGADQSVLLLDPKTPKASTPLGVYSALGGSSPDGKSVVVADVFSRMLLTVATGKTHRIETHQVGGAKAYGGDLALVGDGSGSVQQVAVFDEATGQYASYVIYQSGAKTRILYGGKDFTGSIDGFSVSPNGQFVAINVVPDYATSVSDGYAVDPRATSITTVFVDVATGAVVRSVTGFDESW